MKMEETKTIYIKRNGRATEKGLKIEVSESINSMDYLKEAINEVSPGLSLGKSARFYSIEGTDLSDFTLVLVKNNDTIFFEPHGKPFDSQNILDQFQVLEQLGAGGFGNVHKAVNTVTGQYVAIKYMDISGIMYYASRVEEIYKEAQALKKLKHSNIVQLYFTIIWKHYVVLIMEYVSGGDLQKLIASKGEKGLCEVEARFFFQQIVDAVFYCHSQMIIHRDLKLENVLLTEGEPPKIKLIDFGIAGDKVDKTGDKTEYGSLYILPPEALKAQCVKADPAIDVWAMGVLLYILVCGCPPFSGKNEKEITTSIIKNNVEFSPTKKRISPECKKLILGLLEKNRDSRLKMEELYTHEWMKMPEEELKKFDELVQKEEVEKEIEEKKIMEYIKNINVSKKGGPKSTLRKHGTFVPKHTPLDTVGKPVGAKSPPKKGSKPVKESSRLMSIHKAPSSH